MVYFIVEFMFANLDFFHQSCELLRAKQSNLLGLLFKNKEVVMLKNSVANSKKLKIKNLALEGAGIKGIATCGALLKLEEKELLNDLERIVGSSSGALIASLLAVGYTPTELKEELNTLNLSDAMDGRGGFLGIIIRIFQKGWGAYLGDKLEELLKEKIMEKTGNLDLTFAQLYDLVKEQERKNKSAKVKTNKYKLLYVVTENFNTSCEEIFSHENINFKDVSIARAVRASVTNPYFYKLPKIKDYYYVDGGGVRLYPIKVFDKRKYIENNLSEEAQEESIVNYETIGIKIDTEKQRLDFKDDVPEYIPIVGLKDVISRTIDIEITHNEQDNLFRHDKDAIERTIFVDTKEMLWSKFDLTDKEKKELLENGKKGTERYIKDLENLAANSSFSNSEPKLLEAKSTNANVEEIKETNELNEQAQTKVVNKGNEVEIKIKEEPAIKIVAKTGLKRNVVEKNKKEKKPLIVENLVIEETGLKGIAVCGAISLLEKKGGLKNLKRVAGTGTGAIVATLLAAGYSAKKLSEVIHELDFKKFQDGGWSIIGKIVRLCQKGWGIYKGKKIAKIISDFLKEEFNDPNLTFAGLHNKIENDIKLNGSSKYKDLFIPVVDFNTEREEIFFYKNKKLANFRIADAVRASMTKPFLFQMPKFKIENKDHYFCYGAAINNYPISIFDKEEYVLGKTSGAENKEALSPSAQSAANDVNSAIVPNNRTLGIRVDRYQEVEDIKDNKPESVEINNIIDYTFQVMRAGSTHAMQASILREDEESQDRTIFIGTDERKWYDTSLEKQEKEKLFMQGESSAKKYLEEYVLAEDHKKIATQPAKANKKVYVNYSEKTKKFLAAIYNKQKPKEVTEEVIYTDIELVELPKNKINKLK